MTEQQIQKKIIDKYTIDGWYVIKLIKTNKNGIPDLLCLKKDEIPLFIEVKTSIGVVSKLQEYRINELNEAGFKAIILRNNRLSV
jgi:Holliday junction resolvase